MRRWHRSVLLAAAAAAVVCGAHAQTTRTPGTPGTPGPAPAAASAAATPFTTLSHGLFSDVQVFKAAGTPRRFAMLVSMHATPRDTEPALIARMTADGTLVSFVPLAPFYRKLEAQDGKCTFAAGAFENLSRHVQAYLQLPTYLVPIVVGSGRASAFAYAVLAQAPAGTFAAAMSLDFCPTLALRTPPCGVGALRSRPGAGSATELLPAAAALNAPWTALPADAEPGTRAGNGAACTPAEAQAFVQQVPGAHWVAGRNPAAAPGAAPAPPAAPSQPPAAFDAAYASLVPHEQAWDAPPAELAGLPIVELPVARAGTRFAVLLSGDGGWAGIDKGIAEALVQQGVPVAGFDSLRYFWSARTPDGLAADLDRVIRYYAARWQRADVLLIGYSQGADVLPFALNRLPPRTRDRVRMTALLGLGQQASFEFHVSNWIGPSGDRPIAPEAARLSASNTLCLYGEAEHDSLCPQLAPAHARAVPLAGGHHFSGEYGALAARILDAAPK